MHRLYGGTSDDEEHTEDTLSSPLHESCEQGDVEEIQRLLNSDEISPDDIQAPDILGNTPMYYAIESNSTQIVKLLLEKCPELFKVIGEERYKSKQLHMAIQNLNLDIIDDILKAGCPVNTKVENEWTGLEWTPLQLACSLREQFTGPNPLLDLVRILLKYNADPCVKDSKQQTALHIVLNDDLVPGSYVHEAIACLLLDHGVQPDCKDNLKRSPLYLATKAGAYKTVRKLVEEHNVSIFKQVSVL